MRADIERAARAVRVATEFEWTWTTDDLRPFCDQVGWQLSGLDERYPIVTDLEVNRPDAVLYVGDTPATEVFRPIDQICFRASDVVLDRDDLKQELDEIFDALVQRIFELIGQRPTGWWVEPAMVGRN
ncbi:DUF6301 family protein [Nocardia sp. NPDC058519]|uniref:DUF6301 family protein n=1 Tax=Nocardia sp. NPDC058519 TaxID=3346535 RepID=UPI00365C5AC8